MDSSKSGRGILASLERKAAAPVRRPAIATPSAVHGVALIVGSGVVTGALLMWWLSSGPSPLIVHETLPPFVQVAPVLPRPAPPGPIEAAAIVDEVPASALFPPAAVLAPARIPAVAMGYDQAVMGPSQTALKPMTKQAVAAREKARRTPHAVADTDVELLSALVAHANEVDIVEARLDDPTEDLLQRCRRVGGEEGRLCGMRICATRAGDTACHVE
ncbi:hypothetical protein [Pseudoduganella albidiflava]|uniref:Uncharacterized protein n=1 Tax=Pseudoduganella albidiflava TaxID=321983 RepID=A0A411WUQ8_9BURK|nr:hypothetical protein [Pseudoduganella albidiflava]QBI00505.1 hypothetical protein EYF70_06280 [Pseudoduganella albidiflava]GGY32795.1 hypothetical protein GCM10007387_13790 [Pseudoduganella albidiflava]